MKNDCKNLIHIDSYLPDRFRIPTLWLCEAWWGAWAPILAYNLQFSSTPNPLGPFVL